MAVEVHRTVATSPLASRVDSDIDEGRAREHHRHHQQSNSKVAAAVEGSLQNQRNPAAANNQQSAKKRLPHGNGLWDCA